MNAYTPGIERMMKRLFDSLRENDRRRYAAIEATKLGHGGVEYIARVLGAIPRPFDRDRRNWKRGTTWTPDVSEKKGWPQTVDRPLPDPRGELPEGASRPHRRRSDASRRQVDEPVAAGDRQATRRDGDAGQSEYRVLVAPQARIPQAESSEEEDDGPPQSQPQRPVREHRPSQEGVFEGRPARHQHGHEEEGIARQFLPRRQDRHAGNH